eukprot:Rmarinus@m.16946
MEIASCVWAILLVVAFIYVIFLRNKHENGNRGDIVWKFDPNNLHRPLFLRAFNTIIPLLHGIGMMKERTDLSYDSLMKASMKETNLSDFGSDYFREPLKHTIDAIEAEAQLHSFGRLICRIEFQRYLSHRLRLVDYRKRNSELLDNTHIVRPIFIVGYFRTGTSLLFNLLAQDKTNRPLLLWEAQAPFPPESGPDNRLAYIQSRHKGIKHIAPFMDAVHRLEANGPEECSILLGHSFTGQTSEWQYNVPSLSSWLEKEESRPVHKQAYEYYRDMLKVLQIQRGGGRWLLKAPCHLSNLDVLLDVFPDACVVWTHRDPFKCIPSVCSLQAYVQSITTDHVDPSFIGTWTVQRAQRTLNRAMNVRKMRPQCEKNFVDVQYKDLVKDPLRVVHHIYDAFDLQRPDNMDQTLSKFLQCNPQHKYGIHKYSLDQFSIDPQAHRAAFAEYQSHFSVPSE